MQTSDPKTTRFQRLASMPTMQLFASTYCNLSCPYCSQGRVRKSVYEEDLLNTPFIMSKAEEWPDMHFYISGGEPLIHDGVSNFLQAAQPYRHMISFDTNGVVSESALKRIVDLLPPERFGFFNISHHILAGVPIEVTARTCKVLREASIPHFVKYVGTPEMFPQIAQNMEILRDQGTGVAVTILETYAEPWKGRRFPKEYTTKELVTLLNMVTLGTHALQCFGGIDSRNHPCLAGSTYVAYNMKNKGELTTCCHRSDDISWDDTVFNGAQEEARPCTTSKCLGDLMFILGLQGGPQEMGRFEAVCLGDAPAIGIEAALSHTKMVVDSGMKLLEQDKFEKLCDAVLSVPSRRPIEVEAQTKPRPEKDQPANEFEALKAQSDESMASFHGYLRSLLRQGSCAINDHASRQHYRPYYYDLERWPGAPARLNMAKHQAAKSLGFPLKVNVEVTTQCVFKCEFCVLHSGRLAKKRDQLFMKYDDFEKILTQIQPFTTHIEFTGGEPLLNKDLTKMIEACNKANIKTTIATNAKLLTKNNMEKLLDTPPSIMLIAYESGQVEAYEHHRVGGNLELLEHNIKSFMHARDARGQRYPRVHLQTVVSRETVPHMESFWRDAQQLSVDEACSKPIFVWPDGDEAYWELMREKYLMPDHPLSYYETDESGALKETGEPSVCPNLENLHIGSDGKMIHCWYNLLASKSMGNALKSPFLGIWFSEQSKELRAEMKNHTAYEHGCRYCIGIHKPKLFQRKVYRSA